MRPLRDYLLIERVQAPTKSEGGVDLPDTIEEKPSEGYVRDRGPQCTDEIPNGALVRISQYAGIEVVADENVFLLARERDILVVLEEPSA